MEISEVRVKLLNRPEDRLKAFCSITLDSDFVVRDLKIIEGINGPFVAMPSRKLADRCTQCGTKNHLRARFCNQCGVRLDENRGLRNGNGRTSLHADVAHPINSECRERIQACVVEAYAEELERAKAPDYRPSELDDDYDEDGVESGLDDVSDEDVGDDDVGDDDVTGDEAIGVEDREKPRSSSGRDRSRRKPGRQRPEPETDYEFDNEELDMDGDESTGEGDDDSEGDYDSLIAALKRDAAARREAKGDRPAGSGRRDDAGRGRRSPDHADEGRSESGGQTAKKGWGLIGKRDESGRSPGNSIDDRNRGGQRGQGDRSSSDRSSSDRSSSDRSSGDRSRSDRGRSGERSQGDRSQGDRSQGDRSQGDRSQGDRSQGDRSQGDRSQGDRAQGDRAQGDRSQGDRAQGDRAQGERRRDDRRGREGDRGQSDRSQSDRSQSDRSQSDRGRRDQREARGDRPQPAESGGFGGGMESPVAKKDGPSASRPWNNQGESQFGPPPVPESKGAAESGFDKSKAPEDTWDDFGAELFGGSASTPDQTGRPKAVKGERKLKDKPKPEHRSEKTAAEDASSTAGITQEPDAYGDDEEPFGAGLL
jgi:DNA-binding cell septation regulator SpoVG